jgi:hypothetical protein
MAPGTSRHLARLAVMIAIVAVSAAGCGGAESDEGKTSNATSTATQTNGLENKSAAQVEQDAVAALKAAKSVHVIGAGQSDGEPARIDLRFQGNASKGTIETASMTLEIITIGTDTFVKADQRAWQAIGAPASVQRQAAGRWAKLSAQQASGLEGLSSLDSFAAELTKNDSPLLPGVEQTTFEGTKVVVIGQQDGSKLYVANTGPALPLHAENKGKDAGRLDFTEYGTDFHIAAPSNPVDLNTIG